MAATDELKRLLDKAGVVPYRRVGKVRVAHDPGTPASTLAAAVAAVKNFSASLDGYDEPTPERMAEWQRGGFVPLDVCDEPPPRGVDPRTVDPAWLVDRCERYHFRPVPTATGSLSFEYLDGWTSGAVVPLLPTWFTAACRDRRPELVAVVSTRHANFDHGPGDGARPDTIVQPDPEPP